MEFLFKKWNEQPINRKKNLSQDTNNTKNQSINLKPIQFNLSNSSNDYLDIRNHVANVSDQLINLVEKIKYLSCKKSTEKTIISKGNFLSPLMILGESPNIDDNDSSEPFNGDKKNLLDKMFKKINLPIDKIYYTYMYFWNLNESILHKKELLEIIPILHEHIYIQKPKLIIILGSVVAKNLLKLDSIMKYRGTFQKILIKDLEFNVFITFSPSYIVKMNKYKDYEEDFEKLSIYIKTNNLY